MMVWNAMENEYRPKDGTVCLVKIKTGDKSHDAYAVAVCDTEDGKKRFYILTAVGINVYVRTSVTQVTGFVEIEEESR